VSLFDRGEVVEPFDVMKFLSGSVGRTWC